MNDLSLFARSAVMAAFLGAVTLLSPFSAWAQAGDPPIRQADYIVAVVNSEVITNQEVQALRQRLSKEATARSGTPDTGAITQLALEQLINEKAQLVQAREAGIKIDDEAIDQAELNVAANNQVTREELHKRLKQDGVTTRSFREQLRTQLMVNRLREREVEGRVKVTDLEVEQHVRELLQAQAEQVPLQLNLAMILIAVPENSSESDTRALAERAADVARRARSGENFAGLAKSFSQASDRGANGGEMGLRPTERYPELFVAATRELKAGDISAPIRSDAGFHVLKVLERSQASAHLLVTQTRARHILLRPSAQMSQAQAIARLSEVRKDLLSGKADFASLARQMSQDGSAQQGGDLGWANPGLFVPEFEQVMNQLRPGQIGEPLISRFGVHLIEVTDRRSAPMSDQEERNFARTALRDKKLDEVLAAWVVDLRGRAYVELREPPQ